MPIHVAHLAGVGWQYSGMSSRVYGQKTEGTARELVFGVVGGFGSVGVDFGKLDEIDTVDEFLKVPF